MAKSRAERYTPPNNLVMIVGNYGSGKTEISVNLALLLRRTGYSISIADLDIVNPYFRCREAQELMGSLGIEVVIPPGAQQYADLPIVVPKIKGMLKPDTDHISIFDVGGDDAGATLLSSLVEALGKYPYSLIQVINSRRPFTDSVDGCLKMKEAIERASRLKVSGFAVNSHLIEDTTAQIILEGYELATEVSKRSGVPIEIVAAMGELALSDEICSLPVPILKLERTMLPPWLHAEKKGDREVSNSNDIPAGRVKPIFRP